MAHNSNQFDKCNFYATAFFYVPNCSLKLSSLSLEGFKELKINRNNQEFSKALIKRFDTEEEKSENIKKIESEKNTTYMYGAYNRKAVNATSIRIFAFSNYLAISYAFQPTEIATLEDTARDLVVLSHDININKDGFLRNDVCLVLEEILDKLKIEKESVETIYMESNAFGFHSYSKEEITEAESMGFRENTKRFTNVLFHIYCDIDLLLPKLSIEEENKLSVKKRVELYKQNAATMNMVRSMFYKIAKSETPRARIDPQKEAKPNIATSISYLELFQAQSGLVSYRAHSDIAEKVSLQLIYEIFRKIHVIQLQRNLRITGEDENKAIEKKAFELSHECTLFLLEIQNISLSSAKELKIAGGYLKETETVTLVEGIKEYSKSCSQLPAACRSGGLKKPAVD